MYVCNADKQTDLVGHVLLRPLGLGAADLLVLLDAVGVEGAATVATRVHAGSSTSPHCPPCAAAALERRRAPGSTHALDELLVLVLPVVPRRLVRLLVLGCIGLQTNRQTNRLILPPHLFLTESPATRNYSKTFTAFANKPGTAKVRAISEAQKAFWAV